MKPKSVVSVVPSATKSDKMPLRWGGLIPLSIRIVLCGKDERGQAFAENTQTVGVDRRGARILTSHAVALGAHVAVDNKAVGRKADAKVVWRGDNASPQKSAEIIVELTEPSESGSIWGIRFPSRNDKKSIPPSTLPAPGPPMSAENTGETNSLATSGNGELLPATCEGDPSAGGSASRTNSSGEWLDLGAELEGLASSPRKGNHGTFETTAAESAGEALAALRDDAERIHQSADEAVTSLTLAAEKAAAELRAAREEAQASLTGAVEDYDRRLAERSASGLEDLQRRSERLLENFQQRIQATLDDLQQNGAMGLAQSIQERVEDARRSCAEQLQQQAMGARESLTEELRASVAALIDEAGIRLAGVTQSCVERVAQNAEAATEEGRTRNARALEEQGAAVSRSVESAVQSVRVASDEVLARLHEERVQASRAFEEQIAAAARSTESAVQSVRLASDEILAKLHEERVQASHAFEEHTAAAARSAESAAQSIRLASDEILAKLHEERVEASRAFEEQAATAARSAESAAQSLQLASNAILAKLHEERVEASRAFEEQTAAVGRSAESAAQSLQLASAGILAQLEASRQQIETAFDTSVDGFRRHLAELSGSEIERLRRQADAILGGFESQLLQNTLEEFQQKVAQQVADQIPTITQNLLDRSVHELQKQADETVGRLSEDLKASRTALVEETREQIAILTRASLESLRGEAQTLDEASRSQLAQSASQHVHEAVGSIERAGQEAVTALQAAQRDVQSSARAHTEEYEKRLAERSASTIEELERNAGTLLETSRDRLQSALNDLHRARATELTDDLHRIAEGVQQRCVEQLERQSTDAVKALNDELQGSRTALVDETQERIAAAAKASLESVNRTIQAAEEECRTRLEQTASQHVQRACDSIALGADQGVVRLQTTHAEVRASLDTQTQECGKRLAELSASAVEGVRLTACGLVEELQGELQTTLDEYRRQGTTELTDRLQRFAEDLQQRGAEQLQRQSDDGLKALNVELQAFGTALLDQTRERIAAMVTSSLESLNRKVQDAEKESRAQMDQAASQHVQRACDSIAVAADQGVSRLQAAQAEVQASLDAQTQECGKRLAELSTSAFEEFGLTARGRLQEFKSELQTTLDDFQRQGTTELTDRLQRFADDLRQRGSEQLQKQADEALKTASDELKASSTKLADDAARQLADSVQASVESLAREAKTATEESRARLAELVTRSTHEATDSISLAAEQAVNRLRTSQEEAQASFSNEAERHRKLLGDLSASGIEELQHTADSVLQDFRHSLQDKAHNVAEEAGGRLQATLQGFATTSLRESESKHEGLVKNQRRIFQESIDLAAEATLRRLTQKLSELQQERRGSMVSKVVLGLVAIAPTILFAYLSIRPVMRLRVDPPAEFLAAIEEAPAKRQATEERVARAYWDWAYLHLQHKYPFAAQLPEEPPVEMEVEGKDFPSGLEADLTKHRYWRKLREAWALPQAWDKSSLWDFK